MKLLQILAPPSGRKHPLLLLLCLCLSAPTAFAAGNHFEKTYAFESQGDIETLHVKLPLSLQEHYSAKPRHYAYGNYTVEDPGFEMASRLAGAFERRAEHLEMDEWMLLNMVVDFVQSLEYQAEAGEYPKYPVETLVDGGGDCEDTAILLAALLDQLGMDCILLSPPGHMAVGVAVQGLDAKSYLWSGKKYYYVETTGLNWSIGAIPPAYAGAAKVYALPAKADRHAVTPTGKQPSEPEAGDGDAAEAASVTVAFYRTAIQENYQGGSRVRYRFQVRLEGEDDLLSQVQEVQYRFAKADGAADPERPWTRAYASEDGFAKEWTSTESLPMHVRIFFKDGRVVQTLLRPDD